MPKSARTQAAIAAAAAIAILVAMSTLTGIAVRDMASATNGLSTTQDQIATLEHIGALLASVESGARGFVLTGRESDLGGFEAAIDELGASLARLRASGAEHEPAPGHAREDIGALVHARIASARAIVDRRRTRGVEPARQMVVDDRGAAAGERVRREIAARAARGAVELARGRAALASTKRTLLAVVLCGGLLSALSALFGWHVLHREVAERRRAVARHERRTADIQALAQLGQYLQACRDLDEAYELAAQAFGDLCPGSSGALSILRVDGERLETLARWGAPGIAKSFALHDCWALRRGTAHVWDTASQAPVCAHVHEPRPGAYSCRPMLAQGAPVGVLHVAWPDASEPDPDRLAIIANASEQVALAFANLQLREMLHRESLRDALTGVHNRRWLDETLTRELGLSVRRDRPLAVIMLDVDHFKKFNDLYGHAAGDAVLVSLGKLLRECFRATDMVCRYGGEEFVIVLPDATSLDALDRIEDVRSQLRSMSVVAGGRELPSVSVSAGIAAYPEHGASAAGLLEAADAALYAAKAAGRDRVMVAAASAIGIAV